MKLGDLKVYIWVLLLLPAVPIFIFFAKVSTFSAVLSMSIFLPSAIAVGALFNVWVVRAASHQNAIGDEVRPKIYRNLRNSAVAGMLLSPIFLAVLTTLPLSSVADPSGGGGSSLVFIVVGAGFTFSGTSFLAFSITEFANYFGFGENDDYKCK